MARIHTTFDPFTIQRLKNLKEKKLNYNLEFQRSSVWKKKRKQRLIESLINGYTIGSFVLRLRRDGKLDVLDGQQRLQAIFSFLRGEYKTAKGSAYPDITYAELEKNHPDAYADFNAAQLFAIRIEGGDEQDIAEIFTRLQEGMPLNSAEKLNAFTIHGEMRGKIIELTKHRLFRELKKISNQRFAHREICASLALLEIGTDFGKKIFPNLRFADFVEMYENYKDALPTGLNRNIRTVLSLIYKVFGKEVNLYLTNKSDLLQTYLLCSYLLKNLYIIDSRFSQFIKKFLSVVDNPSSTDVLERKYNTLRGKGQTKENIEERFKLMLKALLRQIKLKQKDENRLFSSSLKKLIYSNSEGVCDECRKWVNPRDANYHHKAVYIYGGRTTAKNGILMHKKCHIAHHKKHGYR